VVVVVSVESDEVALRRGIVNFGLCRDAALKKSARAATRTAKVGMRERARTVVLGLVAPMHVTPLRNHKKKR
jgi:hypothetical protein